MRRVLGVLRFRRSAAADEIPRLGFLSAPSPDANSARIAAFRQGLHDAGYMEGKNILIEWRWAEGHFDRLPSLAAELVRLNVDVIVSSGPSPTRFSKQATTMIPIVMAQAGDPVGWIRGQSRATWRKRNWIVHLLRR